MSRRGLGLRAGAFDPLGARNLLDQNYQLAQGYPDPGRSVFMSAKYKY